MNKFVMAVSLLSISAGSQAADFVHPHKFSGSEQDRAEVITYIKANVKETYTKIGMGDAVTLRMMEQEELSSFKQLTRVENSALLDNVIRTYCNIGMCNYNILLMMYNEQDKAASQELEW